MLDFDSEKNRSGVLVKMKSEKVVHKKGAPKTKGYIFKRPHSSQPLTGHQGKKKSSPTPSRQIQ